MSSHRQFYNKLQQERAARQQSGATQQERAPMFDFSARGTLNILAVFFTAAAVPFWHMIFSILTPFQLVAGIGAIGMAIAPPVLTAFIIPWSPAGMLVNRILGKTWGFAAVVTSAMFLLYVAFEILYSWWAAQPNADQMQVALQMTLLFIILFIIIPALMWTPMLVGDLKKLMQEDQLAEQYAIYTKSQTALLKQTLYRAQLLTAKGFANLVAAEREELAGIAVKLVEGIQRTQRELADTVRGVAGIAEPFDGLDANNSFVRDNLEFLADELVRGLPDASQHALPQPRTRPGDPVRLDAGDAADSAVDVRGDEDPAELDLPRPRARRPTLRL